MRDFQRSLRALKKFVNELEHASRLDPRRAKKARSALRDLERAGRRSDTTAVIKAVGEFAFIFLLVADSHESDLKKPR